jgi:hypothetical protein
MLANLFLQAPVVPNNHHAISEVHQGCSYFSIPGLLFRRVVDRTVTEHTNIWLIVEIWDATDLGNPPLSFIWQPVMPLRDGHQESSLQLRTRVGQRAQPF